MKSKAIFMILIIVCSIFYISVLTNNVSAAVDRCCEKSLDGNWCRESDSCDDSYRSVSGVSCSDASFCGSGCCVSDNSCYDASSQAQCDNIGGQWNDQTSCNEISDCRTGCCDLGGYYEFGTKLDCSRGVTGTINNFFEGEDESSCNLRNLQEQEGCCVESCNYGTRGECGSSFDLNSVCSSLTECSQCESENSKGCYEDGVYWFDSCGNRERLVESCDYDQGEICGQVGNDFACISVNCDDIGRKNGESWCEFDEYSDGGAVLDAVGSRHYIRSCIESKVVYEECRDFRQEICVQGIDESTGLNKARCVVNNPGVIKELTGNDIDIPRGGRFWEGIGACEQVSGGAKLKKKSGVIQNWINIKDQQCSNVGDCGDYYNWVGEFSNDGFSSNCGGAVYGQGQKERIEKTQLISGSTVAVAFALLAIPGLQIGAIIALVSIVVVSSLIGIFSGSIFGKDKKVCIATCSEWVAPAGGDSCESCMEDPNKPCTEYRCRSLGQACDFVSQYTQSEGICIASSIKSFSAPAITAYEEVLSVDYDIDPIYVNGVESGYRIVPDISVDEGISFGVRTDKFARCKYSLEPGIDYDDMNFRFSDNKLKREHNISLILPSILSDPETYSEIKGEYNLYLRCDDNYGNSNDRDYEIKLKAEEGVDERPPIIMDIIANGNLRDGDKLAYHINDSEIVVYTHEPAQCKYSLSDTSYSRMSSSFDCASSWGDIGQYGLYECRDLVSDLSHDVDNIFYIKCEDLAGNVNQESVVFVLENSDPLEIVAKAPGGEVGSFVRLEVDSSSGAENGNAICEFKNENDNVYVEFLNTGGTSHRQLLGGDSGLVLGEYSYDVKCEDVASNVVEDKIEFTVAFDSTIDIGIGGINIPFDISASNVVSIVRESSSIVLTLDEGSSCEYGSQRFGFGSGISTGLDSVIHYIPIAGDISDYYIECEDEFGNPLSLGIHL